MGVASATTPSPQFKSSITAEFNNVAIPGGDVIWFSSVLHLTGPSPTSDLTVIFTGQTLTFTPPGGTPFVKHVPKGEVLFSTTATSATTVWNVTDSEWVTTVPVNYHGDVFLSGYSYYVGAGGLPGNTQVNWSGRFVSPDCLFQLSWKWTAAVYTQFAGTQSAPDYSGVVVQPTDGNNYYYAAHDSYGHQYGNDNNGLAGTPLNFQKYLTQGAMGGSGHCHQQGQQYSPSACVQKPQCY